MRQPSNNLKADYIGTTSFIPQLGSSCDWNVSWVSREGFYRISGNMMFLWYKLIFSGAIISGSSHLYIAYPIPLDVTNMPLGNFSEQLGIGSYFNTPTDGIFRPAYATYGGNTEFRLKYSYTTGTDHSFGNITTTSPVTPTGGDTSYFYAQLTIPISSQPTINISD